MGRCYNTTVVAAPIATVWQAIRDFHDLGWAEGVVTKADKVGDRPGDCIGARRVLNDAFHETLLGLNDHTFTIQYSIDDGPGPVAKDAVRNYIGTVQLHPVTDVGYTFVTWTSTYDSADSSAVGELCNPIYQAVLGALKKKFA